jgi:hypothetical protein
MTRISRPYLLKLAERLDNFCDKGVFTAEHRWELVKEAADTLRCISLEDDIQDSMKEVMRQKVAYAMAEKMEDRPSDGAIKFFLPLADIAISTVSDLTKNRKSKA